MHNDVWVIVCTRERWQTGDSQWTMVFSEQHCAFEQLEYSIPLTQEIESDSGLSIQAEASPPDEATSCGSKVADNDKTLIFPGER
jgi:hypothetical protein